MTVIQSEMDVDRVKDDDDKHDIDKDMQGSDGIVNEHVQETAEHNCYSQVKTNQGEFLSFNKLRPKKFFRLVDWLVSGAPTFVIWHHFFMFLRHHASHFQPPASKSFIAFQVINVKNCRHIVNYQFNLAAVCVVY